MAVDEDTTSTDITITVDDEYLASILKRLDNLNGIEKISFADFETNVSNGEDSD